MIPRALLALLLAAPAAAGAVEVVALLPASGANVDGGTVAAAHEVLRGHLERTGSFAVRVAGGGPVTELEPTPAQAVAAAQEVGASRAAVLRLALLGSVLHARLTVYEVPGGRTLRSDDLTAGGAQDLDPVLQRLAQGWAEGSPAAEVAEVGTVTTREAAPPARVEATRQLGLRLGGMTAYGTVNATNPFATGVGIYWMYDARDFLFDLSGEYFAGDHLTDTAAGFGAYLPLGKRNVAPYAGGGLRYAWTAVNGHWNHGFQPYLAVGLILGRLSTVGIRGEASWFWNAFGNQGRNANGLVWSVAFEF